jgi:hypothetical protein
MRRRGSGLRLARQHRFGILALLAIVALALGFYGYLQVPGLSVVDAAYYRLSLLAFNFHEPPGSLPLTLEIARFSVPAVAAFATFTALALLLEDEWHLVRASRQRKHVVVCGLGRRGMQVVRSLRVDDPQLGVVAVESDRANPNLKAARELGAIVLFGDSTEPDVLHAARVHRARSLISVLPDDVHNAQVASQVRELCDGNSSRLEAFCHVADVDLAAELNSRNVSTKSFQLEWFSVPERAAKTLLRHHGELRERARAGETPPHFVVIGEDQLAQTIILTAARQWDLAHGGEDQLRITVAGPKATAWSADIVARYPIVASSARIDAVDQDLRAYAASAAASREIGGATAAFVCAPTDSEGLELGFAVSRVLAPSQSVVVRLLVENAGFVELLGKSGARRSLRFFSVFDEACKYRAITEGLRNSLASAAHETYLEMESSGNVSEALPAKVPYSQLDEQFVAQNLGQADHFREKLEVVKCELAPATGLEDPFRFTKDEVELLAELEHERWNVEKKRSGYVRGKPRIDNPGDGQRKQHPSVDEPWETLSLVEADKDRAFVRELPKMLAANGYKIVRCPPDPG